MPKSPFKLAAMGVDALIKLRDDIGAVLGQKTADLKRQLQRLETGSWGGSSTTGRGGAKRGRPRKGRKLPPKYRDTKDPSLVWAGRGARPRWMEERIKAGAKQEDFLIAAGQGGGRRKSAGRRGRKRKAA
jgi:DNA-binding protein H-NS